MASPRLIGHDLLVRQSLAVLQSEQKRSKRPSTVQKTGGVDRQPEHLVELPLPLDQELTADLWRMQRPSEYPVVEVPVLIVAPLTAPVIAERGKTVKPNAVLEEVVVSRHLEPTVLLPAHRTAPVARVNAIVGAPPIVDRLVLQDDPRLIKKPNVEPEKVDGLLQLQV